MNQALLSPAVCLVNPEDGTIVGVDAQLADWLGATAKDVAGKLVGELFPGLAESLAATQGVSSAPFRLDSHIVSASGTRLPVVIHVTPISGVNGHLWLLSIGLEPVWSTSTSLGTVNRDALTGLPDRRELSRHYAGWRQAEHPVPHAALFMDLDNFKAVNDNFGHAIGDRSLCAIATRWQSCVRDGDLIVRYGGDEFVALIAHVASYAEVQPIADRLSEATARPISLGDLQLTITLSIGVALATDTTGELDQLIALADRAMYAAKRDRGV